MNDEPMKGELREDRYRKEASRVGTPSQCHCHRDERDDHAIDAKEGAGAERNDGPNPRVESGAYEELIGNVDRVGEWKGPEPHTLSRVNSIGLHPRRPTDGR
jgi:hypothetical protein